MMWYWGGGVHWWGWLLGTIGMIAFWALIICAVWYIVSGPTRRPPNHPGLQSNAKRVLDERLARGEIDTDEYRRLLAVMREGDLHTGNGHAPAQSGGQRSSSQ